MANRTLVVCYILIVWFAISFVTNIIGPLMPVIIKDFGLSLTLAGFLPFSFFLAYGVVSIPAGMMVEVAGPKATLVAAFCLNLTGALLFALLPGYGVAVGALFVIGEGLVRTGVAPLPRFEQFRVLPQGGNVRLLHNIDLQVQVARFFGFPISVAVFLDTGIVTNSLRGFTVSQLRHSLGLGLLRWQLPVGFISVEYAIPLDPELGDDPTGRLHFNFGFVF